MNDEDSVIEVVSLSYSPSSPRVGQQFVALVELDTEAGDREILVRFEKQRVVANGGGFLEARPTGRNYFVDGYEPKPIVIMGADRFGVSSPMIVRKDVSAPEGDPPVRFPENLLLTAYTGSITDGFCTEIIKIHSDDEKDRLLIGSVSEDDLVLGQKVPNLAERDVVGAATARIRRGTPAFEALVRNTNSDVVFKDEERTGADRMMTRKLSGTVDALANLVKSEWPGIKLRVTEAWDENEEHGANSVHYEARGVDITASDRDGNKLGRLGRLAFNAGSEWVFFENSNHIHASVSS